MKLQDWTHFAEITASVAVIISLLFLTHQVGENTSAIERQILLDRSSALTSPFLSDGRLPAILSKIKAIDGVDPLEQSFIDRYLLTYEEASIWVRYQLVVWKGLEADFIADGESPKMESYIEHLLTFADVQLAWKNGIMVSDADFIAYVERLRQEK